MPPKIKITREQIIEAAVQLVREQGAQALNARKIAAALHCSTQPVFSNFTSMEEVRMAVVEKADLLNQEYIRREMESGKYPAYKASGMAYVRFAAEEKELFRLLYMRDRTEEEQPAKMDMGEEMEAVLYENTGLSGTKAELFHLEMWAFVHGIAAMFATGFVNLDWDLVSRMLTDVYQGLRKQYGME